jgi:hypothetical protein
MGVHGLKLMHEPSLSRSNCSLAILQEYRIGSCLCPSILPGYEFLLSTKYKAETSVSA